MSDRLSSFEAGADACGAALAMTPCAWIDPVAVAAGLNRREGALALIAGAGDATAHGGRRSFVACEPDLSLAVRADDAAPFEALRDPAFADGGVVGLMSYDAGARPATGERGGAWPDLMLARYPALLAFDHQAKTVRAVGRGRTEAEAREQAGRAAGWLAAATTPAAPSPPASAFAGEAPPEAYEAAVADVVARIAAGELFQANIARAWSGRLEAGRDPFEVFLRLSAARGAAYGAFWRLGGRAWGGCGRSGRAGAARGGLVERSDRPLDPLDARRRLHRRSTARSL